MSTKLFVSLFLILIIVMTSFYPIAYGPVEAATSMSVSISVIESRAVKVSGQVSLGGAVLVYCGVKYRLYGEKTWSSEDKNRATSNPFNVTISGLRANSTYEVCGYCVYKSNFAYHIESAPVKFTTRKDPAFSVSFDEIKTTSVRMLTSITTNSNVLSLIDYTVNKSSDNALIIKATLMTNVTSGGTKAKTITGLSANTDYYAYLLVKTALGTNLNMGPYNFRTARFAVITIMPKPTSTPTTKPSPTPTLKPSPTPTPKPSPSPTPTTSPKPTPSVTPKTSPTPVPTPTSKPTPGETPTPAATPVITTETSDSSETSSSQSETKPEDTQPTGDSQPSAETTQITTDATGDQAQGNTQQGWIDKILEGNTPILILILSVIGLALIAIIVLLVLNIRKKRG